jgi:adenylate cyclase
LVEGTFRRDGARLRIAVRLVDGGSGRLVWAGRSEQSVGNFVESQDELLMEIGGALEAELARQERERASAASHAADVDAYLTLQRGLWHHYRRTAADSAEAQRLFRESIALDPDYAQAWAALARATYSAAWSGWTNAPPERGLKDAIALAREAVQVGPRCAEAWYALGDVYLVAQDLLDGEHLLDESFSAFENAIALNPNHARARAKIAAPLASAARPEEAAKSVELALRLSPRDPTLHIWLPTLALSHYIMGNYEAAVAVARRQVTLRPTYAPGYNYLAAGLARLGRREEAAHAFDRLIRLESDAMERMQRFTRTFRDRTMAEHVLDGLRLAASR